MPNTFRCMTTGNSPGLEEQGSRTACAMRPAVVEYGKKHRRIAIWKRMYRHLTITCLRISSAVWNLERSIRIYAEAVLLSGEMISPNPVVRSATPRTPRSGDKISFNRASEVQSFDALFLSQPKTIPPAFFPSEAWERSQKHVFLALYRHLW